ncbi:hypothetical protein [Actinomadura rubrisoli]|uniref:Uncharacterized protein n=1 Tax=Actinomadura rubrisoli TaxID=2530368 RepID=A0A4V2YY52_9ACTN|nr:hypothetical protein [Actinomadura rubrisoli]TDD91827.1 hypothetical protein E1298_11290 [Actinomadura rubrisoli]
MAEDVIGSLLDGLGPDLYRENAFRVTGLAVSASARDIRRHTERLRVASRFETDAPAETVLFGEPPDPAETRQAAQRLRDPARRLLDEFFWFWPLEAGRPDQAVAALRRGDTAEAERVWKDDGSAVAQHNLAVLAHARALDSSDPALWHEVFETWQRVVRDDPFWMLLETRAREFADPRLGPGTAARLREDLPEALLGINARLAVTALRDGRRSEAEAHIGFMNRSGFDRLDIAEALRRAVEPDAARLRSIGEKAERAVDADPAEGAEAAQRLLDQAAPLLDALAIALPPDHPVLRGAKDDVAVRTLHCVIPYCNETDDWKSAVQVIERALPVAATKAVRKRLKDSLATVRSNLSYSTCWFCKDLPSSDRSVFEQKLYGNVRHTMGRVTWQVLTVNVPRCAPCRSAHVRRRLTVFGSAAVTVAAGAYVGFGLFAINWVFFGFLTLVGAFIAVCVILGSGAGALPPAETGKLREFPPVRDRLSTGAWFLGAKPPGVN